MLGSRFPRITHQIIEENYNEKELFIIGVSKKGFLLARKISLLLNSINQSIKIELIELLIDKTNPLSNPIELKPSISLDNKKSYFN
jgi:pyrimidine operon attenuation protein/uracil phosphoribosyltransferase